jgi:hypothetical protein
MEIRRTFPPAEYAPSHMPLKQAASPKGKMEALRSCLAPRPIIGDRSGFPSRPGNASFLHTRGALLKAKMG